MLPKAHCYKFVILDLMSECTARFLSIFCFRKEVRIRQADSNNVLIFLFSALSKNTHCTEYFHSITIAPFVSFVDFFEKKQKNNFTNQFSAFIIS